TMLVTSSTGVWIYDAADLRKTPRLLVGTASLVAFSADRTLAAFASEGGDITVYDIKTGKALSHLNGHTKAVYRMAFRPDGNMLVSASDDLTVRTWDVHTGEQKLSMSTPEHDSPEEDKVFISPDGGVVALHTETYEFWSTETGKRISVLED